MPRYIQHPETNKLIPAEEYESPSEVHHFAQGDFKSYVSPVDGTLIDDRGKQRRHMQQHGIAPTSEFSESYMKKRENSRIRQLQGQSKRQNEQRRESIGKILGEFGYGR